ncbi:MATE family efflux transporter [Moorena producens JHB]|uniref:MATE family efflux transporter n=1 Tax=Moorena producens (strain JHB) TaxID=1454205 RepID=A0A1D9G784_MOOP1|nr:MATE family efflux transporter [Moorena producens]AOY83355.1 MATE family efflux transporter [Moorena producens JHB]
MTITSSVQNSENFVFRFLRLSLISTLANMTVPLAGLIDAIFLGHIDNIKMLAGVTLATIIFDYLYRILQSLRDSTSAITAHALGSSRQQEEILLAILQGGFVALVVGLVILLLQYPLQILGFAILNGTPDIETQGMIYFQARIWGAPAVLLIYVLTGWYLGQKQQRTVLIMSLVGVASNAMLDYGMIVRLGWGAFGAGIATALSQYIALSVALVGVCLQIKWSKLQQVSSLVLRWKALKKILALSGNITVRFLVLISAYAIFTNFSATQGNLTLSSNGLLLQWILVGAFAIHGIRLTSQTFIGSFASKGADELVLKSLYLSMLTSIPIVFGFAVLPLFFPVKMFRLLTNHTELYPIMQETLIWLFPFLLALASASMLEGYFIGLKRGVTLRNAALAAFIVMYLPISITARYLENVNLLWASLVVYMVGTAIYLARCVLAERVFQQTVDTPPDESRSILTKV